LNALKPDNYSVNFYAKMKNGGFLGFFSPNQSRATPKHPIGDTFRAGAREAGTLKRLIFPLASRKTHSGNLEHDDICAPPDFGTAQICGEAGMTTASGGRDEC
jgi:hypothetical protein